MKRFGCINSFVLSFILILFFHVNIIANSNNFNSPINETDRFLSNTDNGLILGLVTPPVFTDTFWICPQDSIYDTVIVPVTNASNPNVSFTIVDGIGSVTTSVISPDTLGAYYQALFDTSGVYPVTYLLVDANNDSLYYYYQYVVYVNQPPVIENQYGSSRLCNLGDARYFQVTAIDNENDALTFIKVFGPGSIDPNSGLLTYTPDTSGVFVFKIAVNDGCSSDTALVYDTLVLNSPPQVSCQDTTVYLCQTEDICFDVYGHDPDGDSMQIYMLEGLGTFNMTTDSSGQACFFPANIDSATYQFVFRATDSCQLGTGGNALSSLPQCCQDTVLVTVIINQPPQITPPGEQKFFTCDGGEFCFNIDANDPDNDSLTYNILSDNATISGNKVCVTAYDSTQLFVTVEVVDKCGAADTTIVPVIIEKNHPPVVTTADDFDISLCQPETVCLAGTVDDIDFNISSTEVNFGTYDPGTQRICFNPDTSGIYTIILKATDSCGLVDSSITKVNVKLNEAPYVNLGEDYATDLCAGEQICVTPTITDDNLKRVVTNFSFYNEQTGEICFTPDTSGIYVLEVKAIDDCDVTTIDTLTINVHIKDKPFVDLGADRSLFQCTPEEICVDVNTIPNYSSIITNLGQFNQQSSQICFIPDTAGTYTLIADITDSCGFTATDSVNITVTFDNPPTISNFNDTSVYLCYPTSICLPLTVGDVDGDLDTVLVNRGTYENGQICFVPYDSGSYPIIVTAIDKCGLKTVDTAMVTVTTDQSVSIIVPNDTTFFVCELDTSCFPVYGIPDNAEVSVTGINTWYDSTNKTICYFAECSSTNKITLTVKTPCNTYEKQFSVTVNCNTNPLVILPQDTTYNLCEPTQLYLPVGVSDVDHNLKDITVEGGVYDPVQSKIYFNADTSGIYSLKVTATDSCSATDVDEMLLTVNINKPPVVLIPNDTTIDLCNPGQISLPVSAYDPDSNLSNMDIVNGPGILQDGNWVYNVVANDSVEVVVRATDSCGAFSEDTFKVIINVDQPPVCNLPSDTTIFQCTPTEVSLPINAIDPDGDNVSYLLVDGPGEIVDSSWVYTPSVNETVNVTIKSSDDCGLFCEKTFAVTFVENEAPICNLPQDTSLFLCEPSEVRLPLNFTDEDSTVDISLINGPGQIIDGYWVYTPTQDDTVSVTVRGTDNCGAYCEDSFTVAIDINDAPVCEVPSDTTIALCEPTEITLPVIASDVNNNLSSINIISGPGSLIDNYWSYVPDSSGNYEIVIQSSDSCGAVCVDTFNVSVDVNHLPTINNQSFSQYLCQPGSERVLDITATDADNDPLHFELLSGVGVIDSLAGVISYTPDTAGTYNFEVTVYDSCGADTATITDVITINNPPTFYSYDSTVYLCDVQEVSFPVTAFDIDGDSIQIYQVSGPGQFTQLTDTSGETRFVPDAVDSATYTFVYCITDSCGNIGGELATPPQCGDTINITVVINQAPSLVCPGVQQFFTCQADTFCFNIDANDLEFDPLTFSVLSDNATIDGKTVCVIGSASDSFNVIVEVTDTCGHADTCNIPVVINGNRAPYITSADDFDISLCQAEAVCFAATVDDLDFNIDTVKTNYGTYDFNSKKVCFDADTSGTYMIILSAVDSCGATAFDTTNVTVHLNKAPVVDLGDDFTFSLCEPSEVCLNANVMDDQLKFVSTNFGVYNEITGQLCFTPDTSGTYELILNATDDCDITTSDTVLVTVSINQGPFVDLGDDFNRFMCDTSEICINVNTIENYQSLVTSPGANYNSQTKQLCFTPDTSGTYSLFVEITDSCGITAADTVNINISFNQSPELSFNADTTVYLCYPKTICLPLSVSDPDNNLKNVTVNRGSYDNGQVCFVPYDSGQYQIIATAVDSCGEEVTDTAVVHVITDQGVSIVTPSDTTIFVCELDTMCFPISGIPDNGVVEVTGINTWYNAQAGEVCFLPECATANKITVNVTTPCGTFSKQFTVTVECNTPPLVILPPDTAYTICEPTTLSIPVGVSDVDHNLLSISTEGGTYNPVTSKVNFMADTSGTYIIKVTAVDSCQAIDSDEIVVNVHNNTAPFITFNASDTTYLSCQGDSVCFPIEIGDVDGNLVSVTTSIGTYHSDLGAICLSPDTSGIYCVVVNAVDSCGAEITDTACVSIKIGSYVNFECPTAPIPTDSVCVNGEVCVPLNITGNGAFQVTTSMGNFSNGQLCFNADTSGMYTVKVTAQGDCNTVTCDVDVQVNVKEPVQVSCPGNIDTLLCGVDTLAFDYTVSSSVDSVYVTAPAYLNNGQVFVPVLRSNNYLIYLIAMGQCGVDTCQFNVNATLNRPPSVSARDTSLTTCTLDSVCIPFTAVDVDSNLANVTSSVGVVNGDKVCFLPDKFGLSELILTAQDECGAITLDTVKVTINEGPVASIICPGDQFATLCGPDSVSILVPITPSSAKLTVYDNGQMIQVSYNWNTGKMSFYVNQSGEHNLRIIADALCSSDTCELKLQADIAELPTVTSPQQIDTLLCLAQPDTLCFPVTVNGTGVDVNVNPIGNYQAGYVCIPVDTVGTYNIDIVAYNSCGADTSTTTLNITADEPPQLTLPNDTVVERCPDDTDHICIDGIFASDTDSLVSLVKISGPGDFQPISVDSGQLCFLPDQFGDFEFVFEAFDGCNSVVDTFHVMVNEKANCDVCVQASIDGGDCVPVGMVKDVKINVQTNEPIAGFVLLLSYDPSVMIFNDASIAGTAINNWEYFVFRLGSPSCGSSCPSGLVRFVGIADVNNGNQHPPTSQFSPNGTLINARFQIVNDQNLGGQFLPISFIWYGCGDNTFSDPTGNKLFMDKRIYNPEHNLIWDEDDNINYPDSLRSFGFGASDSCLSGASSAPIRCIEFINGGICVIAPESLDARGDINLNGVAYEIGDAVLYSNYFIYGLSVFTVNVDGQIAASDVNADGMTLSVADLVLLIRVVTGDAEPLPKLIPYEDKLVLTNERQGKNVIVTSDAVGNIGAAWLVYDIDPNIEIKEPKLLSGAKGLDMQYVVKDNQLKILIFNIGKNRIPAGVNKLVEIPYSGTGNISLSDEEFVDYQGRPYRVTSKTAELPHEFTLNQNYPNPFNPSTSISFALPQAHKWSLSIYNINGYLVKQFNGFDEAGLVTLEWGGKDAHGSQVASGVYLYRLEAGNFNDTKKMILIK